DLPALSTAAPPCQGTLTRPSSRKVGCWETGPGGLRTIPPPRRPPAYAPLRPRQGHAGRGERQLFVFLAPGRGVMRVPHMPAQCPAADPSSSRPTGEGTALPGPRAQGLVEGDHRPAAGFRPGHAVEGDRGVAVRPGHVQGERPRLLLLRPAVL